MGSARTRVGARVDGEGSDGEGVSDLGQEVERGCWRTRKSRVSGRGSRWAGPPAGSDLGGCPWAVHRPCTWPAPDSAWRHCVARRVSLDSGSPSSGAAFGTRHSVLGTLRSRGFAGPSKVHTTWRVGTDRTNRAQAGESAARCMGTFAFVVEALCRASTQASTLVLSSSK